MAEGLFARARSGAGVVLLCAGTSDAIALAVFDVRPNTVTRLVAVAGIVGVVLLGVGRGHPHDRTDHPQAPPTSVEAEPDPDVTRQHEELRRGRERRRVQAVVNAGDGMVMVFQPVVDLRDGTPVGHEALARFADGRPANEWFADAHAVGVGVELEMTAIRLAVEEFVGVDGYLSVNLSPPTLTSTEFLEFMVEHADPRRVVVELTEHAVVDDYQAIRSALDAVRELGTRVAVDDAGSGISSLRHILRIAPEIIKLDRSLIATIDTDSARRALVLSLAQFATGISADLVAEGVERAGEMTACYESGVRYAQGYLLGRPGPLPDNQARRRDPSS